VFVLRRANSEVLCLSRGFGQQTFLHSLSNRNAGYLRRNRFELALCDLQVPPVTSPRRR
jgi:hypothetical protein